MFNRVACWQFHMVQFEEKCLPLSLLCSLKVTSSLLSPWDLFNCSLFYVPITLKKISLVDPLSCCTTTFYLDLGLLSYTESPWARGKPCSSLYPKPPAKIPALRGTNQRSWIITCVNNNVSGATLTWAAAAMHQELPFTCYTRTFGMLQSGQNNLRTGLRQHVPKNGLQR